MSFSIAGKEMLITGGAGTPGGVLPGTLPSEAPLSGYVWKELSYDDWVELNRGTRVRVRRPGGQHTSGSVDEVADDASCFWVWLDHARGRVLISRGDGATVWR